MRKLLPILAITIALSACGQPGGVAEQPGATATSQPSPTPTPAPMATLEPENTPEPRATRAVPTLAPSPTLPASVPATPGSPPAAAAPDDIVDRARTALAGHLAVAEDTLTLVESEARQWPDGALGCPDPSLGYTQAIVPGYLLVFNDGTQRYAIHTSEYANPLILCQDGLPVMLQDLGPAQ